MEFLTKTLGRIIFALPFAVFGFMHLSAGKNMAGMVPVPGGVFWIYFTGIALIAASLGIIFKYAKYALLGLALLLVLFALTIHLPGLPAQSSLLSFLKDLALAGAALTLAGYVEN